MANPFAIPELGPSFNSPYQGLSDIGPLPQISQPDAPVDQHAAALEQLNRAHAEAQDKAYNDAKFQLGKARADSERLAAGGQGPAQTVGPMQTQPLPQEIMRGALRTVIENPIVSPILDRFPDAKQAIVEYFAKQTGADIRQKTMTPGEKFGEMLPQAAFEGAVIALPGAKLLSLAPGAIGKLGVAMLENKGRTVIENIVASIGAEAGSNAVTNSGIDDPVAQGAGAFVGAVAGGYAGFRAGRFVTSPAKATARFLSPAEREALKPPGAIPASAQTYNEAQIAGDLARTQSAIDTAIESVPRQGSSYGLSADLHGALMRAKKYSDTIEDALYARVPKETQVPQDLVKEIEGQVWGRDAEGLLGSTERDGTSFPEAIVKKIIDSKIATTRPVIDEATGRVVRNGRPMTLGILMQMHSDLRNIARIGRAAGARGDITWTASYLKNVESLDNIVLRAIDQVNPDDIALTQARDYTKKQAELFKRGVVGKALGYTPTGDPIVDPTELAAHLSAKGGAGNITSKQIQDFIESGHHFGAGGNVPLGAPGLPVPTFHDLTGQIEQSLGRPLTTQEMAAARAEYARTEASPTIQNSRRAIGLGNTPVEGPAPVSEAERQAAHMDRYGQPAPAPPPRAEITTLLEDTIRAEFREAGDQGEAQALQFLSNPKNQERVRYLSGVAEEFTRTVETLDGLLATKAELEKSALSKWIKADPQVAYHSIFSGQNPAQAVAEIKAMVAPDAAATAGLKAGMLDEFFRMANNNPLKASQFLEPGSKVRAAFEALLTPQEMARFQNIVSRSVDSARHGLGAVQQGVVYGARLLGAMMGRSLNTGTLQAPQMFSNSLRRVAEKMFRIHSPGELMMFAIQDPKWEKVLYFRAPSFSAEADRQATYIRRLLGLYQGAKVGVGAAVEDQQQPQDANRTGGP